MKDKQRFICYTPEIKANAVDAVTRIQIGDGPVMVVEVMPLKRSLDQSARFHALCGDISKQLTYANRRLDLSQWKVLLISAHAVATKIGADVVPGIEGEFVNLREATSDMSIARMASLIEYATAYAIDNGVRLRA